MGHDRIFMTIERSFFFDKFELVLFYTIVDDDVG